MMPVRTTFNGGAKTPWCQGDNISPQLSWTNAPSDTKSYVMTMVTAEPEDVNMVIYDVPATTSSFAEGELSRPSDKYVPGKAASVAVPGEDRATRVLQRTITSSRSLPPISMRRSCPPA
jgi:phosphatidylethanolamine-binding protein (PEBP) family uncharacterized protein